MPIMEIMVVEVMVETHPLVVMPLLMVEVLEYGDNQLLTMVELLVEMVVEMMVELVVHGMLLVQMMMEILITV